TKKLSFSPKNNTQSSVVQTPLDAELTPVYLLKLTGSFMGISEKCIPWGIRNSTAGAPQPGHKATINPFPPFRRNHKHGKLMG
ncbi:MAG: hypothetical protein MJA29_04300, partial [Candidatus Omnitrophica bacterium]|nr:hypothetical protein [Candidatus Omnitrophota bacterium]